MRAAIAGLTILGVLIAAAHADAQDDPPTPVLVDAYDRLHAAAERSPRAHAGRDVLAHGRPSDGRLSWALVRAEARRLWLELHPALVAARQRAAQPRAPAWWVDAAAGVIACESGGRPDAVSAGGTYRGLLQFDLRTWASVGGSGDPAAASRDEQLYRGFLLWRSRGWQPWPVCGARAG